MWVADGRTGDKPVGRGSGRTLSVLEGPTERHCSVLCGGAACHYLVSRGAGSNSGTFQPNLYNTQFPTAWLYLDCLTLKMEALHCFKMSGATHPMAQCHLRRPELSAALLWEPQMLQPVTHGHFYILNIIFCTMLID